MNLSNIYSKLHPYKNFISAGMRVYYPGCGWYTILGSNGVSATAREENTGEMFGLVFDELQRGWELSEKDIQFIESSYPETRVFAYECNGSGVELLGKVRS